MSFSSRTRSARLFPSAAQTPLSLRNLFRWAVLSVSGNWRAFIVSTLIAVLATVLTMYNAQLVASFPSKLQASARPVAAAPAGQAASTRPPTGESAAAPAQSRTGLIDRLIPDDNRTTAIVFAVSGLLLILVSFLNRYVQVWSNNLMLQRLQHQLHDKLIRLGPNYHARHDLGENNALILQFAPGAQAMLRDIIAFPFVRTISLAVALSLLFYNLGKLQGDAGLTYAILFALIILLPLGGWWLSKNLRVAYGAVRERQGAFSNALVDSLSAPQEVQLMNAAGRRSRAIGASLASLLRAQLNAAFRSEVANQFQVAVPTVLQIGLILYAVFGFPEVAPAAGATANTDADKISAIIGIYFFVPLVVGPIQELIKFYTGLNTSWPQIEKIGLTLDEPLEVQETGRASAADLASFEVALREVRFAPQPDRIVLDGVSFAFPPGQVTALVGRSGSGKTTILRLIARLSDPQKGSVTIGGRDIRELRLAELRSLIGTVSQFPLFVEADVRENLRLASETASDAEMEAACRAADLWAALERISPADPLAAPVPRTAGKSGLAGGERRRLAIARALLGNPRILLLDEPSTGIDALSLGKIVDTIRSARVGRTVLLVDHDMDLVGSVADQIVCLEDGRFTDIGSPAELATRPSLYAKLAEARRLYADGDNMEVQGSVPVRPVNMAALGQPKAGQLKGMAGVVAGGPKGPPPQMKQQPA